MSLQSYNLTTDINVRFGLVYVEDIYKYLDMANFTMTECDSCRKACCKLLPEISEWKHKFVTQFKYDSTGVDSIDPAKLFDVLEEAFRHAHHKSHAISILFNECHV